ncbi:uncharacterized protein PODANS_1_16160, partial [Podospora anserina S mat+]
KSTYFPVIRQWATAYTSQHLTLGQRTTSPVESSNRMLKSFVVTGKSTVKDVFDRTFDMVAVMEKNVNEARRFEKDHLRRDFMGMKLLGETPTRIAWKPLDSVVQHCRQLQKYKVFARNPEPDEIPACTGRFTANKGLPCLHLIHQVQKNNQVLELKDFHPFWWLERSLVDEDRYLQYQDFDRVTVLRCRPRGSDAFAPDATAPRSTVPLGLQVQPTPTPSPPCIQRTNPQLPSTTDLRQSLRRTASQWEAADLEGDDAADAANTTVSRPATVNGLGTVEQAVARANQKSRGSRGNRGGARGGARQRVPRATQREPAAASSTPASTPAPSSTKPSSTALTRTRTGRVAKPSAKARQAMEGDV